MKYIGIDPDTDSPGFAVWDKKERRFEAITKLPLFDLVGKLKEMNEAEEITVIVSAGWLHGKTNWHKHSSAAVGMKIAEKVGRNHEVGKQIVRYCKDNGIKVEERKPFGKVETGYFRKITGWMGNLDANKDMIDAAMMVYGI